MKYNSGVTEREKQALYEQGYLIVPGLMDDSLLAELRQCFDALVDSEGEKAGWEFKQEPDTIRLANLVDKGEVFRRIIAHPQVLEAIRELLGPDAKLSSLNGRSANAHGATAQPLHCDTGLLPDGQGYSVANSVWLLDDFTPQNGATRIVPGSHRWGRLPESSSHPDEILVTGKAGDVVIFNAHAWHGGSANQTDKPRRAIHAFYCRRDIPQQLYQKQWLSPETVAALTPEQRQVLAYDDPVNDSLGAAGAGRSGFMK